MELVEGSMAEAPSSQEPYLGLRYGSRLAAIFVALVGCLVLVGRLLNLDPLSHPLGETLSGKANTGLAFVLAGTSLWMAGAVRRGLAGRLLARAAAALVAVVGLFTLGEYLYGWDFGIDQLLVRDSLDLAAPVFSAPPAPNTAVALLLAGTALLLLHGEAPVGRRLSLALAAGAGMFALLAAVGYAYGSAGIRGVPFYSPMSLPTSLALLVLCLGIPLARPNQALVGVLASQAAAGVLARRLLIWVVAVPLVLGWLLLQGQLMKLYDQVDTLSLAAVSCVTILVFQVLAVAWRVDQMDSQQRRAQEEMAEIRCSQKRRITERMAELDLQGVKHRLKQAEDSLQESEEILRFALESSPLGFWDWNLKTGEMRRMGRWAELFGEMPPPPEPSLQQLTESLHPGDRAAALRSIQDHFDGLTPSHQLECRLRTEDGQDRWVLDRAWVVRRDPAGRPLRVTGTRMDITDPVPSAP